MFRKMLENEAFLHFGPWDVTEIYILGQKSYDFIEKSPNIGENV
jgi:hypothetical protein